MVMFKLEACLKIRAHGTCSMIASYLQRNKLSVPDYKI